jgi:hypothetical protein
MASIGLTVVLFIKWSNSVCTKVKYLQLSLDELSKAILKLHSHPILTLVLITKKNITEQSK